MLTVGICLLLSLVIILAGCDLFTNGIEWAGKRLKLGEGAVGSVLAAVGTCLPETLIAIMAVFLGKRAGGGEAIGIGAILGAPMMLATLAFFVTGLSVVICARRGKRSTQMNVNHRILSRDVFYFFMVFSGSALATLLPTGPIRWMVAGILVLLYILYVRQTFADVSELSEGEDISPLHFNRRAKADPPLSLIVVQVVSGLVVLVAGAHFFVGQLTQIAVLTGIPTLVLSLIITPVATELPEKINSVLWIRQGKDTLALGNISGAMVFQSSIPTAIGIVFTSWKLDGQAIACVVFATCSAMLVLADLRIRRKLSPYTLMGGGLFYIGYLGWVFGTR